jgi:hypothetical protein
LQLFNAVLEKHGYGGASDDIQQIMLAKLTGMEEEEAQHWQEQLKDLPRILEAKRSRMREAIKDAGKEQEIRRNRSWQGFKDAISKVGERTITDPIKKYWGEVTSSINTKADEVMEDMFNAAGGIGINMEKIGRSKSLGEMAENLLPESLKGGASYGFRVWRVNRIRS